MGKLTIRSGYKTSSNAILTDIITKAAAESGYNVILSSGDRPGDSRQHGKGNAIDIRLVDPATGKEVPNYQSGPSFRIYEEFAQKVKTIQSRDYPKSEGKLRWGGYFSGKPGKYGALDLMHFDMAGDKIGMQGGSWEKGLKKSQAKLFPGAVSVGMLGKPTPKVGLLDEVSTMMGYGESGKRGVDPFAAVTAAASTGEKPPIPATMSKEMALGRKGGGAGNALDSVLNSVLGLDQVQTAENVTAMRGGKQPVEITVNGGGQQSTNINRNQQRAEQLMQQSVEGLMGAVDPSVQEVAPVVKSRKTELKQIAAAQGKDVTVADGSPVPANKSAKVQAKQDSVLSMFDEGLITGGNISKPGTVAYNASGYGNPNLTRDASLNIVLGDAMKAADGLNLMAAIRDATQPKALAAGATLAPLGGKSTPGSLDDLLGQLDSIHENAAAGAAAARAGGTQGQQQAAQNSNSGKNSDGTDGSLSSTINKTMDAAGAKSGTSTTVRSTTTPKPSTSTPAKQSTTSSPANKTLSAVSGGINAAKSTTPTGSTVTRAQADAIRRL